MWSEWLLFFVLFLSWFLYRGSREGVVADLFESEALLRQVSRRVPAIRDSRNPCRWELGDFDMEHPYRHPLAVVILRVAGLCFFR